MPVKPTTVRQAVGKNNIKPTSHAHASAPASSAVNTAAQASLFATVAVPNANKAPAQLTESDLIESRSSDECKQKVGALLRDWDWN
jgi:hypothetical protein